jgi:hypothetical protein
MVRFELSIDGEDRNLTLRGRFKTQIAADRFLDILRHMVTDNRVVVTSQSIGPHQLMTGENVKMVN